MNIKALGLAALVALAAPLSAQAVTITGADSDGNVISNANTTGLTLGRDLSQVFVFSGVGDGAQNIEFEYLLDMTTGSVPVRVTILPQPGGVKDLVLSFELNGSIIGGPFVLTDNLGNGTPLALGAQPQITLNFAGAPGDTFSVLTSFSGVNANGQGFNFGVQAVPLPATALLFMTALGGLGFLSRRKAA